MEGEGSTLYIALPYNPVKKVKKYGRIVKNM